MPISIDAAGMGRRGFFALCAGLLALALGSADVSAASLQQPAGRVILTVSGNIKNTNKDGTAVFDRDMLEGLGMTTIKTATPWAEGVTTFEGPTLQSLLEAVGAEGTTIEARALNDYKQELPLADAAAFGPILAVKRNGEYMPIRDKGPIFIVYPYDSNAELRQQLYYGRSVWQLKSLEIR